MLLALYLAPRVHIFEDSGEVQLKIALMDPERLAIKIETETLHASDPLSNPCA